jgi:MoaA/NifB/PqqE/SkfB family radical SAM enzyme
MRHIEKAVRALKKTKMTVWALTLISNYNQKSLRSLFQKCNGIGFDIISVNYPVFSKSPVYTIGGEAIDMTREELIRALREVIELKKEFNIVNPVHSIRNIIRYLKNKPPLYECLAGFKTLFVDWNFNAYPCMYLPDSMGKIFTLNHPDFKRINCNECNMSWYRDFSVYCHGLKSVLPFLEGIPSLIGSRYA